MTKYSHKKIEKKWQERWDESKIYNAEDFSKKPKYYCLIEFPYPSGAGLHVGHLRSHIAIDIVARKKRMEGYNVLYPIGWDAFGLPTENYAIKTKTHPKLVTENNIKNFTRQIKSYGPSFDWSREINTTDPEYYKWTQWIFLKLFNSFYDEKLDKARPIEELKIPSNLSKKVSPEASELSSLNNYIDSRRLAYEAEMNINWCPSCKIGLANEEVISGECERCHAKAEKKTMKQWMLRITKYADRLISDLNTVDYLDKIKAQQINWIGRSEGAIIKFPIFNFQFSNKSQISNSKSQINSKFKIQNSNIPLDKGGLGGSFLEVFTTRPDTIFGCIYMVLAPEHSLITNYKLQITNYDEVKKYIEQAKSKSDLDRTDLAKEKTGVELKGIKAINPANNEEISIWVADYVLASYGTGAIMAVPAHDQRDFEFAKKFGLAIKVVVKPMTNKLAIIIHGFEGKAESNFFPWTKKELEKLGYEVILENMPNPYHPKMEEWIDALNKYKNKINENTIIIGHSLGGSIAPYFVSKLNKKIKALYLVAPASELVNFNQFRKEWKGSDIDSLEKTVKSSINWSKVKENLEKLIVFLSDNDDYIPIESKEFFEDKSAKCIILHKKGHIQNPEFPELLEEILKDNTKTPKRSPEVFDRSESYRPKCMIKDCHPVYSINDDKKVVKSEYGVKPAEGLEPSDYKLTILNPHHAAGELTPDLLYQNNGIYVKEKAYTGDGVNINSGFLNGFETEKAKKEMTNWLSKNNLGRKAVNYKLRDWIFSRQHYWGEPIPIIKCEKCGNAPLDEKDLPLELPDVEKYEPTNTGESPLANITKWVNVKCPKCGGNAKRETDTMPNWAGSSWYFLRYLDPNNNKEFASRKKIDYWMPVDLYNGGMEHTTLHLLYSRFWHKFLYDLGYVNTPEPYKMRRSHGMILAENGQKMSKSRGNVINPDEVIDKYGADTIRLYEMFMGPYGEAIPWNTNSLVGMSRFLERIWNLQTKIQPPMPPLSRGRSGSPLDKGGWGVEINKTENPAIDQLLHKTIKKVTEDIDNLKFNTAISQLMILLNELEKEKSISNIQYPIFLILLSPFAPHITEELWEMFGNKESIHLQKWPEYDKELAKEKEIELVAQVNGKVRDRIKAPAGISEADAKKLALESEKIKKWIEGKVIKKVIFVKGRLINIVIT